MGGVQRSLAAFINATTGRYSIDQELITGSQLHPYIRNQILSTGIRVHYFARFNGLPIPKYPPHFRRWYLANLLRKVQPDTLVLWNHSKDYHGVLAAQKIGARVLYFEHGAAWGYKGNHIRRRVFEKVDGILCISQAARRVLELKWGLCKPIRICRNALATEMQPQTVQAKRFPLNRPIRIGVAGRIISSKGFGLALRACKLLLKGGHHISLHIAGDGNQRPILEKLAADLGIVENCRFLGHVQDMQGFFQHIDIFLVPSIYEPFGLVSVEAQAWGCVTIVAGVDGLAETVVNNQSGSIIKPTLAVSVFDELSEIAGQSNRFYYDPEEDAIKPLCALDPEEIYRAIQNVILNPTRFEIMSQFASRRILTEFTFSKNTHKIVDAINSLMRL
jgi:glycosyltransferase involved in cell wall biosynthesis